MGETVSLGRVDYTVLDTEWLPQIGQGPSARIPRNRFFLIHLSASNRAGAAVMLPNLTVQGEAGETYPELSDGSGVPRWLGFIRQLKAGESADGNIVFDAPPGHYRLRVAEEDSERAALVDIPLSFGTGSAEVPVPTPQDKP